MREKVGHYINGNGQITYVYSDELDLAFFQSLNEKKYKICLYDDTLEISSMQNSMGIFIDDCKFKNIYEKDICNIKSKKYEYILYNNCYGESMRSDLMKLLNFINFDNVPICTTEQIKKMFENSWQLLVDTQGSNEPKNRKWLPFVIPISDITDSAMFNFMSGYIERTNKTIKWSHYNSFNLAIEIAIGYIIFQGEMNDDDFEGKDYDYIKVLYINDIAKDLYEWIYRVKPFNYIITGYDYFYSTHEYINLKYAFRKYINNQYGRLLF